ncbi:MAG: amidohydrolase [Erysipelotrichaceae bacterium]|nr:amidohydrolase [Erysipelotrichaceae bacterium]
MKTAYYNGVVYTGDSMCSAFVIENGTFVYCGNDSTALSTSDCSVDLKGKFVCAGFNDSHMHLLNYGQYLNMARLDEHTTSLQELLSYVKMFREEHDINGSWLKGRGWNQDYFSDVSRMPTRYDIDRIVDDIPVMLTRACGHCCVVNSKALEVAGITDDVKAPEGGAIGRENGVLNGLFFDNAIELISKKVPLPDKKQIKELITSSCKALNRYGITSSQIDDYCVFRELPYQVINEAYRELEDEGVLSVRVNQQANFTDLALFEQFVSEGNITGTGTPMYRIGPLKMLGDGSLGGRTAWLSRPYADDPSTCGFPLFSDSHMNEMISCANRNNMQVAVHAIGDRCLDQVLDAIELALREYPRTDHRHGIVHCQISRPDQLERIRRLHLHVYAQSVFLDYDNHIVEQRAGKQLAQSSYSWKTLMNKGVTVSNGSDAPVEMPDVMRGIECAVTRCSLDKTGPYLPEEAFTVKEAIDSFTKYGAAASFEENVKGRIKENYYADFVILDKNPFEEDKFSLHDIKILKTFVNGKCVYDREETL